MIKRRMSVFLLACLLVLTTGCAKSQSTQEISTDSSEVTTESIPESIPETNTSEADSEVPVTIKIANYAVLEKGYEEFWQNVKTGMSRNILM